jgi:hypothetical protein
MTLNYTTAAHDSFRHEVACCVDLMGQDDARGEILVFIRVDHKLISKTIDASQLDLDNLQQYETILFDGGNSAGDTWKHVFFPLVLQHHLVDENALPF